MGSNYENPLMTVSVGGMIINFVADFDLDAKGFLPPNYPKNASGMYINIFKSDFDGLAELQYFYLLRYREKPELLLEEDYVTLFEKTINNFELTDESEEAVDIMKSQFYTLLSDIIGVTNRAIDIYSTQHEFLCSLMDSPDARFYGWFVDDDGYACLDEED